MKLAVPITWETQLSMMGNKHFVWEQLIDQKKLPFMAMLRNLRNLITYDAAQHHHPSECETNLTVRAPNPRCRSGISNRHHELVLKRLCDERQVAASKQFPFRFLNAYQAINFTPKQLEDIGAGM